jgi:diguanylate cyclase (GGDEF)-like protein
MSRARGNQVLLAVSLLVGAAVVYAFLAAPDRTASFILEGAVLAAAAALVAGVHFHGTARPVPWYLVATGLGLLALGDSFFVANDDVFDAPPVPSTGDIASILGAGFLIAGVIAFARQRQPRSDSASLVEALVLGIGVLVPTWVLLMEPHTSDVAKTEIEQFVGNLYPALDVALFVALAWMVLAAGLRPLASALLAGGVALLIAGNSIATWADLHAWASEDVADVVRIVACLAIAVAGLHSSTLALDRRRRPRRRVKARLALIAVAAMTPMAFAVADILDDEQVARPLVFVLAAVGVPVLAMVRVYVLRGEVERSSQLDHITALPNRALLFEHLTASLEQVRATGNLVAVLDVDIDHFKRVNEEHGHRIGDELLVLVSERLRGAIRQGDIVARVGGDEFIVVCDQLNGNLAALAAADRMSLALVDAFEVGTLTFHVSASIGVATGRGTEHPDLLLNDAHAAMREAKVRGRGRAELFEQSMRAESTAGATRLDHDLVHAIEREQLRLYYQPQVDLRTGAVVGVEALLRWHHPEWGTLPPATVIAIAEESGLLVAIGEWTIEDACSRASAWAAGGHPVEVTINVSHGQLVAPGFLDVIDRVLARWDVPPTDLAVDLTDPGAVAADDRAVGLAAALRERGVHIAIDGFDASSPLKLLQSLPADRLKLDRSLTEQVTGSDSDPAVIAAVIGLAREMGMQVIGLGVETRTQRAELERLGCHDGIGNLWAPPLPPGGVLDQVLGRQRATTA